MKNILIPLSRDEWESMLEFKKSSFRKRYIENQILLFEEFEELENQSLSEQ